MSLFNRHILVTGANGFIGKNLVVRLNELANVTVTTFIRGDDPALLPQMVSQVDAVIHLAGENRPTDEAAFMQVNSGLTSALCNAIEHSFRSKGRLIPMLLASSTQAEQSNPYGRSKVEAERSLQKLAKETGNPCIIFRLPGVFGKWCKPNYNSVVATFCHKIACDLPIEISDSAASLRLAYVDDVITSFLAALETPVSGVTKLMVEPEYSVTLGELAEQIRAFANCRTNLITERVGTGLARALYATYVSYLPTEKFSYSVRQYADLRGIFVEMLKTPDSGQFSYFTAHPGVTRGGHYHHTKTEKFLVIKGEALFRFRHLLTNEFVELRTSGGTPQVVDTIPGWTHDITNISNEEMIVMLWANEKFDRQSPDTIAREV
jgi:UDP-2-acetamido-2,6-beta-L-arabino-hexul-4-ose reductase